MAAVESALSVVRGLRPILRKGATHEFEKKLLSGIGGIERLMKEPDNAAMVDIALPDIETMLKATTVLWGTSDAIAKFKDWVVQENIDRVASSKLQVLLVAVREVCQDSEVRLDKLTDVVAALTICEGMKVVGDQATAYTQDLKRILHECVKLFPQWCSQTSVVHKLYSLLAYNTSDATSLAMLESLSLM